MKILYRYIDSNGKTIEEHTGHLGNWSLIPGSAAAVQVVSRSGRGDEVEAWLKRLRDEQSCRSHRWHALDDALDDYRLHGDTGTPLSENAESR